MSFNHIVEFVKTNWLMCLIILLLVLIVLVVVDIIIACKKGVKPLNIFDTIIKEAFVLIPKLITLVEAPGNGSLKKNYVLKELQLSLYKKFGFKEFDKIEGICSDYIEEVLQTPQSHGK